MKRESTNCFQAITSLKLPIALRNRRDSGIDRVERDSDARETQFGAIQFISPVAS